MLKSLFLMFFLCKKARTFVNKSSTSYILLSLGRRVRDRKKYLHDEKPNLNYNLAVVARLPNGKMALKHFNIMKKYLSMFMLLIAAFMVVSCSDDESGPTQAQILKEADGIITLKDDIGKWDAAYLTQKGYFCYEQNAFANADNADSDGKYSNLTYTSATGNDMVSLLATKDEAIPSQMITSKGIAYFSFPNDSILELLFDDGKELTMIDSIAYSKKNLPANAEASSDDMFKAMLANTAYLINAKANEMSNKKRTMSVSSAASGIMALLKSYASIFEEVCGQNYTNNADLVAKINKALDGNYVFTENASKWFDNNVENQVVNTISLWTGKATFKVGGSSCTLSGTIWCPVGDYNAVGTYGIICDTTMANLTIDDAEYVGKGYQGENDLSFGVDFRGFKPNTTYYYRAYYKFNDADHGGIVPKHGDENAQVFYDNTIKSFTTGDNLLAVDVVMCIDVTGSMSSIINTVKRNAIGFYDSFKQACDEEGIILTGLNTQVMAFRDLNVDSPWLQTSVTYNLPTRTDDFKLFVNSLYATGGGDTPESGLEVLDKAFSKTDWGQDDGYHRQVIILWTDAPYLIGEYAQTTLEDLSAKWNKMPSGRRLILFAPNGDGGNSNGGSWGKLDSWTNVIHEEDLTNGFNNFDYILKSIIGELTSKSPKKQLKGAKKNYFFRPN